MNADQRASLEDVVLSVVGFLLIGGAVIVAFSGSGTAVVLICMLLGSAGVGLFVLACSRHLTDRKLSAIENAVTSQLDGIEDTVRDLASKKDVQDLEFRLIDVAVQIDRLSDAVTDLDLRTSLEKIRDSAEVATVAELAANEAEHPE